MSNSLPAPEKQQSQVPPAADGTSDAGRRGGSYATGTLHAGFQLLYERGGGRTGRVFRARRLQPSQDEGCFAVKFWSPSPELAKGQGTLPDLVSTLVSLRHPNVTSLVGLDTTPNTPIVIAEYVEGVSLTELLDRVRRGSGELPIFLAVWLAGCVLDALDGLQSIPENSGCGVDPTDILLGYCGDVKVGGFGLLDRRLAATQGLASSPGYAAPELLRGEPAGVRADIFSVGVLLYEMLAGRPLFAAADPEKRMRLNEKAKIPPIAGGANSDQVSPELERVVQRALSRDPAARFADNAEMRSALDAAQPSHPSARLALASVLRTAFPVGARQQFRMRQLDTDVAHVPEPASFVALCSDNLPDRERHATMLLDAGISVELHEAAGSLRQSFRWGRPPGVVTVDLASGAFSRDTVLDCMLKARVVVPIVGIAPRLTADMVAQADAVGAVDLVWGDVGPGRLMLAAEIGAAGAAAAHRGGEEDGGPGAPHKLLLVTDDPHLVNRLRPALWDWGFSVEIVEGLSGSLEALERTTFEAVIYDMPAGAEDAMRFVRHHRSAPGVAIVPVLGLSTQTPRSGTIGETRTAVRAKDDPPVVQAAAIAMLLADHPTGRRYNRYTVDLSGTFSEGDATQQCMVDSIGRGGVRMRGKSLPARGAVVSLTIDLPGDPKPVSVDGMVVGTSTEGTNGEQNNSFRIAFGHFADGHEPRLIAFVARLVAREDPAVDT